MSANDGGQAAKVAKTQAALTAAQRAHQRAVNEAFPVGTYVECPWGNNGTLRGVVARESDCHWVSPYFVVRLESSGEEFGIHAFHFIDALLQTQEADHA